MRLPFAHSGVIDVMIAALRAGGYLTDDASADKIRDAAAGISESARDGLAATLNYGSGFSGPSQLTSVADAYILLDSDNTNPTTPYTNYLRVGKGQSGVPITDPWHELLSVFTQSAPQSTWACEVQTGPHVNTVIASGVDDDYPAIVWLGCRRSGGITDRFGYVAGLVAWGVPYATLGSNRNSVMISAPPGKDIHFAQNFVPWATLGTSAYGPGLTLGFPPTAMAFELTHQGGHAYKSYALRSFNNTAEDTLYLNGSYTSAYGDQRLRVAIGGTPGMKNRDPDMMELAWVANPFEDPINWSNPRTYKTTCLIVSPDLNEDRSAFVTKHMATMLQAQSELVSFDSEFDTNVAHANTIALLRVTLRDNSFSPARTVSAFGVSADRKTYSPAFVTGNADVSEIMSTTNVDYPPGTVLSLMPDGQYLPSNQVADTAVMGVVPEQPGLLLGSHDILAPGAHDIKTIKVALAGTVPVLATTAMGDIKVGNLLVSYFGGVACRAPDVPAAGTVIGKAMEELSSSGVEVVTRKIKMLVLNR